MHLVALILLCQSVTTDTIVAARVTGAPVLDGVVGQREYGAPTVTLMAPQGTIRIWVQADTSFYYIAALLPDSTYYWGDDFVVSLDPTGERQPNLDSQDRQWYVRRAADSSVVNTVTRGRWVAFGTGALGARRAGPGWKVQVGSSAIAWSVELRIARPVPGRSPGAPRIAFRVYDDRPAGWVAWPRPPVGVTPREVETHPNLWATLRLVP
jgi:hypothetical protein